MKKFKRKKCTKCGKFYLFIHKMFNNKKGFVCMDCDEGEEKDD